MQYINNQMIKLLLFYITCFEKFLYQTSISIFIKKKQNYEKLLLNTDILLFL